MNFDQILEQQPSAREAREQDELNAVEFKRKRRQELHDARAITAARIIGALGVSLDAGNVPMPEPTFVRLRQLIAEYYEVTRKLIDGDLS